MNTNEPTNPEPADPEPANPEPTDPEPANTSAAASAPGRSRYGWVESSLYVAVILVIGSLAGASVPIVFAAIGMAMLFVGPFYASYFVPTTIARWRRAALKAEASTGINQKGSLNQRYILNFGTTNQRMTLILNVVLLVNLVSFGVFVLASFLHPPDDEALFSPAYILGTIAVIAGIPLTILNLRWRLTTESAPAEAKAIRHQSGSWKLIRASRILSMSVWCGYPTASILLVALGTAFGQ